MYSNSSIITPTSLQSDIFFYITTKNPYLNSTRFANLHCAIYIAAFILVVVIFIFKHTAYILLGRCVSYCRKLKNKYLKQEVTSNDFYKELTFLQLFKEFKKTLIESRQYQTSL